jgi:hypothetical protein
VEGGFFPSLMGLSPATGQALEFAGGTGHKKMCPVVASSGNTDIPSIADFPVYTGRKLHPRTS